MKNEILIFVVSDLHQNRTWLYDAGIPQTLYARLAREYTALWHHREPSAKYPHVEHRHYVPIGLKQELLASVRSRLRRFKRPAKSDWKSKVVQPGAQIVSYDESIQTILACARASNVEYVALVMDNAVAVFPESIELGLRLAHEARTDLLYCSQIGGLLPTILSTSFLERWLQQERDLDPRWLDQPESLAVAAKVVDVKFFEDQELDGKFRCWPMDMKERRLLKYWEDQYPELREALRLTPEIQGQGRERLQKIFREYRSDLAAGLELYRIVGTLHDVNQLRQRMMTTSKPLTDYFVVATHYGLFLQKYAGLQSSSHLVDIGCSWGYLGFALANFLNQDGAYLGVEVQAEATKWSKERLGWLGPNFQFVNLDIHNDYYNPNGEIPRAQIRLPIEDGWANVMIAGSVFTHMLEDGVQGYLHEFRRVLAPGGVAAFSYDDSTFWSPADSEDYVIAEKKIPDKTTYYSRKKIDEMVEKAGLQAAREPVNMRQFDRTEYQTWYFATRK